MRSLCLRSGDTDLNALLSSEYPHELLGILHDRFVFSLPFMIYVGMYIVVCLFIQWFIYVRIGSWILFCTLVYNPLLLHLFCCPKSSALDVGSFVSWLLCPFDISPSLSCVFFKHFLAARCFRLILHISCPSPRTNHFCKEPYLFEWRLLLKSKV